MIFYLFGIVKMGVVSDLFVVVDEWLCVYGMCGLCVVDCLIMLMFVLGNINVLIVMVVEKVFDMILEDVCEVDCGCSVVLVVEVFV